ncbi:hypothetical protein GIB67_002562 [Kingdonia uniflora]|uniref:Uncharacterized protein n=1 Tax=Kingdonia uniflora TaxID=39325 RepID=A0A7J7N8T4_9MAGN|nr:hypothetical protein GIB67_002562 [Kingdonia uniflora]
MHSIYVEKRSTMHKNICTRRHAVIYLACTPFMTAASLAHLNSCRSTSVTNTGPLPDIPLQLPFSLEQDETFLDFKRGRMIFSFTSTTALNLLEMHSQLLVSGKILPRQAFLMTLYSRRGGSSLRLHSFCD